MALASSAPTPYVEDNVFENLLDGIHVSGRMGLREGPLASDVLLRRNVVRDAIFDVRTYYRDPYGRRLENMKEIRHLGIVSNLIEKTRTTFDFRNTADDIILLDNSTFPLP